MPNHASMRMFMVIPPERAKWLKRNPEILDRVMKETRVKITIEDSGRVIIEPTEESTPLDMMNAKNVLQALALGFDLDTALLLLRDEYVMEVIDVRDALFDHHDEKTLRRILGRIIGKNGKAKRNIEEIAHVKVSIYKDKVAIIGEYENVEAAKHAIGELMEGKMHSTVYRHLEQTMRYVRRRDMLRYWEDAF